MTSGAVARPLYPPCIWGLIASLAIGAEPSQLPPPLRSRAEVEAVLAKAPPAPSQSELRPLHIVLLADVKDHGTNEHNYPLWQKRWELLLAGTPKVTVTTAWKWPSREQLETADLIVMYCYRSGGGHWLWDEQSPKELDAYLARGGGFVVIHAATYMHVDMADPDWKWLVDLTGLAYGKGNRTRRETMKISLTVDHPICLGLPPVLELVDEPFWPAYGNQDAVDVLGTSQETIARNATETTPQPMFWTYRRGKGRVFGCTPGHYTWTFDDPYFRLILLRGMAWAAGDSPYRFDDLALRGAPLQATKP